MKKWTKASQDIWEKIRDIIDDTPTTELKRINKKIQRRIETREAIERGLIAANNFDKW